jgi:hypothetical protein
MQALQPPKAVQTSTPTFESASTATLTGSGDMREEETFSSGGSSGEADGQRPASITRRMPFAMSTLRPCAWMTRARFVWSHKRMPSTGNSHVRSTARHQRIAREQTDGTPIKMWERLTPGAHQGNYFDGACSDSRIFLRMNK